MTSHHARRVSVTADNVMRERKRRVQTSMDTLPVGKMFLKMSGNEWWEVHRPAREGVKWNPPLAGLV